MAKPTVDTFPRYIWAILKVDSNKILINLDRVTRIVPEQGGARVLFAENDYIVVIETCDLLAKMIKDSGGEVF